jgi:hypothetical protein
VEEVGVVLGKQERLRPLPPPSHNCHKIRARVSMKSLLKSYLKKRMEIRHNNGLNENPGKQ